MPAHLDFETPPAGTPRAPSPPVVYPATSAQERWWLLHRVRPDRPFGNVPLAFSIDGPLEGGLLARALDDLVARHEILRTRFPSQDGRPVQEVSPELSVPMPIVDLRLLPDAAREAQAFRLAREETSRPFDLQRLPLLRAQLFVLSEQQRILVLALHRCIFDEPSVPILLRELASCYIARRQGRIADLEPLPLQFGTHAARQRRPDPNRELSLSWWRARLAGTPLRHRLFGDRTQGGGRVRRDAADLPLSLRSALANFARREGTNDYTLLLTAFHALLRRYLPDREFLVSLPVPGRGPDNTENLLGPYSNQVALRVDLSGQPTFRDMVGRMRAALLDAFSHSAAPFEDVAESVLPGSWRERAALCPFQFTHDTVGVESADWTGLRLTRLELEPAASLHDVAFHIVDSPGRLSVRAEYDAELFTPADMQGMLAHFAVLLRAALANPQRRLDELPLTSAPERKRLAGEWNDTGAGFPRDATVPDLVSAGISSDADAAAVTDGTRTLSRGALESGSNRLARHLRSHGVRPGVTVALCLTRTTELACAIIAVLKAGGTCVALDPDQGGDQRMRHLGAAQPQVFLVTEADSGLSLPGGCRRIVIPTESRLAATDDSAVKGMAAPEDAAWIAFTSGTAGSPLAVEISHRALVNCIHSLARTPGFGPSDVILARTPLGSGFAPVELLLPLAAGSLLRLAPANETDDPARLGHLLRQSRATFMRATPSQWLRLLDAGWEGRDRMRGFCAGETLHRPLAERLLDCCREVWAVYGTAETTGCAALTRVHRGRGPIPVERPIANTQIHVLDAHLEPVPPGVPGEICIGGESVSHRYRGADSEAAESFVPDPFRRTPGAHLFRTGDIGRRRARGEIEIHPRMASPTRAGTPGQPAQDQHAPSPPHAAAATPTTPCVP